MERLKTIIELQLLNLGLAGQHFDDTPARVSKMWTEFLSVKKPKMTTFEIEGKVSLILFKDHIGWSFCPHHLLPVKYTFKIGYIPDKKILGASKPLRVVEWALSKLLVQEDLGELIATELEKAIQPKGVGVVIKGEHLCMQMRGVKSSCSSMVTSYLTGVFLEEGPTREEFILL